MKRKIFACSDHHFGHRNIIKYAKRPFDVSDSGVRKNALRMITEHNSVVNHRDLVYFVGDFSMSSDFNKIKGLLSLLNGEKILIRGNHDKLTDQQYLDAGFSQVRDYLILGDTFVCHYPLHTPRFTKYTTRAEIELADVYSASSCSNLIHGHVHNKDPNLWVPDGIRRNNVCVDFSPNDFKPQLISNSFNF